MGANQKSLSDLRAEELYHANLKRHFEGLPEGYSRREMKRGLIGLLSVNYRGETYRLDLNDFDKEAKESRSQNYNWQREPLLALSVYSGDKTFQWKKKIAKPAKGICFPR